MVRPRVALLMNQAAMERIFSAETLQVLQAETDLVTIPAGASLGPEEAAAVLKGAHVCVTSWGSPRLTAELLDCAPDLRLIVHAAGSIKPVVSDDVFARNITITSGAPAIGRGVAETALGLIITSMKNVYALSAVTREKGWSAAVAERNSVKEMVSTTVGIVGAGHVGRYVMGLLRHFDARVLLSDPTLTPEAAAGLGATLVSLDTLMAESDVVSLHAPSIPATYHMINAKNLKLMKDGATIINTARGSLIDEAALIDELSTGRIKACIDVTDPEPPKPDNPLRTLPNVVMTPHIAGVVTTGLHWLGAYALDEIHRFMKGEPQYNAVSQEQLAFLA